VLLFTCLSRRHASFQRFNNPQQDLPILGGPGHV